MPRYVLMEDLQFDLRFKAWAWTANFKGTETKHLRSALPVLLHQDLLLDDLRLFARGA